jgi:hypothetical protein
MNETPLLDALRLDYYQFMKEERTGKGPAGIICHPQTLYELVNEASSIISTELPYTPDQKVRYRGIPILRSIDMEEKIFLICRQK